MTDRSGREFSRRNLFQKLCAGDALQQINIPAAAALAVSPPKRLGFGICRGRSKVRYFLGVAE